MRIFFLGSGAFGVPTLAWLAEGGVHEVVGCVTQPDRPAGRGRTLTATPVGEWMAQHGAGRGVMKLENVNEAAACAEIRRVAGPGGTLGVDAWVVIAFGQKLGKPLLEGVRAMNLHASLLPRWRGAAPINAAVLAGDAETGNTVITLAERMDAGMILGQSRRAIGRDQTAGELHDLLSGDGPGLVRDVLGRVRAEGFDRIGRAQDESLVTKAGKFSKADGWVDFGERAETCRRRIHGLTPWPGVTVRLGDLAVKLLRVADEEEGGKQGTPGVLIDAAEGLVACGSGTALRIVELQPAGGRVMRWDEFSRGRRMEAGAVFIGGRSLC